MTDEQRERIAEQAAEALRRRQQRAEQRQHFAAARKVGLQARHNHKTTHNPRSNR